jgi:Gamma interferon inducible lysosomal thiol reductase (GILT)
MSRLLFFTGLLAGCGQQGTPAEGSWSGHTAVLDMFVMSQCPYGVQVEDAIGPVKEQLGAALQVNINYIANVDEAGGFKSLHGPNEVAGNIVQLCAGAQDAKKMLPMILCQNKAGAKTVHESWKTCGAEVGLDVGKLETCMGGDEGKKLLTDSLTLAQQKGARGSPTMFLDGQPYKGGRKPNDFLRMICGTYGADAPAACKDIPVPPEVHAVFLSDDRCKACDLHPVEGKLKGSIGGLKAEYLDVKSEEGKAFYAKMKAADPNFKLLPAILVKTDELEKDVDGKAAMVKFISAMGDTGYSSLKVGAKFDPDAEICDNTTDDDGNGQADCADPTCAKQLLCREADPGKVDLFVMSRCPYGAKAMLAMHELKEEFGPDIDLDIHFIGNMKAGEPTSMHGQAEVDDDIREVCAQTKYPNNYQYLDFVACISRDYKAGNWEGCAKEAKMDPKVIDACFKGEGKKLLADSFAVAQALGISSSPTFLVNNKRTFNATNAPKLQTELCKDNPTFAGCKATIAATSPANAAAAAAPAEACAPAN